MVELMVAMTLGLLLTAAVLQTFVGAKRTYEFQQEFSRVQENGRFAMNYLTRAIRQADHWGCLTDNATVDSIVSGSAGSAGAGFDVIDQGSSYTLGAGLGPRPDRVLMRGVIGGGYPLTQPTDTGASIHFQKVGNPQAALIDTGDMLLVTDCTRGTVFQVTTANPNSNTVTHNTGSVPGANPGNASAAIPSPPYSPPSAFVYKADSRQFWIRQSSSPSAEPVLVRGSEYDPTSGGVELVEGIENMQILLGFDGDGDGVADYYNPPPPLVTGDMDEVVAVEVSIVARSLRDNLLTTPDPFEFNGQTYTPADRRLRKVFTANVALRNRLD